MPKVVKLFLKCLAFVWTLPNTCLGCFIGLIGYPFGTRADYIQGAIEIHGGLVTWLLARFPNQIHAMTVGHSILGINRESLRIAREHEHVHVRQYEIWGPVFIPAYLICSGWIFFKGGDPYRDNPFEVEAYRISSPSFDSVGEKEIQNDEDLGEDN